MCEIEYQVLKCGTIASTEGVNKKPILWLKFNWLDPIFTPVRKTNTKYEKGSILRVYFNYRTDDLSKNTRFYRIIHLKQFTPSLGTNLFPTILYIPTDTIMVANSSRIGVGPEFDSQGCVSFFHKYCFPTWTESIGLSPSEVIHSAINPTPSSYFTYLTYLQYDSLWGLSRRVST